MKTLSENKCFGRTQSVCLMHPNTAVLARFLFILAR